ncbi:hypothetical protein ACNH6B_13755 [Shewanella basaltis]|uniref:hypothetical protein n=1 Tax=Shewanella basaltis TaxID=472183 RepID=UPI003AAC3F82
MSKPNVYKLHGLNIQSEIPLPASPTNEHPDIIVSAQKLPKSLPDLIDNRKNLQFDGKKILINQPLFGSLLIEKNTAIKHEFYPNLSQAHCITAILGSGIGTLLHLNGNTPLHGLAVSGQQGAVILLADSGTGKSTLATALLLAGQTVFTDDIIALRYDAKGQLNVQPAHKRFKLEPAQLSNMHVNIDKLCTTAPGVNKLGWDIPTQLFAQQAQPLKKCLFISTTRAAGQQASIASISQFESFTRLRQHIYRPRLMNVLKQQETFFQLNTTLQNQCCSYTINLPELTSFESIKEYGVALSEQLGL